MIFIFPSPQPGMLSLLCNSSWVLCLVTLRPCMFNLFSIFLSFSLLFPSNYSLLCRFCSLLFCSLPSLSSLSSFLFLLSVLPYSSGTQAHEKANHDPSVQSSFKRQHFLQLLGQTLKKDLTVRTSLGQNIK